MVNEYLREDESEDGSGNESENDSNDSSDNEEESDYSEQ